VRKEGQELSARFKSFSLKVLKSKTENGETRLDYEKKDGKGFFKTLGIGALFRAR
jgi:hypothetical protein